MAFTDFTRSAALASAAQGMSRQFIQGRVRAIRSHSERYYQEILGGLDIDEVDIPVSESQPIILGIAIVLTSQGERPAILVDERLFSADSLSGLGETTEGRTMSVRDAPEALEEWRRLVDSPLPPQTQVLVISANSPVP